MSIIHDALKKAQEEQKEKPAGIPYGNAPEAKKKPKFIVVGIIALVAVVVLAYLYIPVFHPKKAVPPKQAAGVKPAVPTAVPASPAPQKALETRPAAAKPEAPAPVRTAANAETPSPDKSVPKTVHAVAQPVPAKPEAADAPERVRGRSKAAPPAAEEGPIRRIPARRIDDDWTDRQYNEALQLMHTGQMREAQKVFFGILGRKPDHVEALNNMGVISASLGNRKEAVNYFNKVLEHRPNYPKAYNNIGLVMMSDGNLQLAEEYFRKAITMEPGSLEPYLNLSASLRAQKRFPEAAKALETPINKNVKDANLYLAYAVAKENVGQFDQAISYYRQYLSAAKPSQVRGGVVERLRYLEGKGKR